MERNLRKEAKRAYKEELKPMGIYQISNRKNGKALIGSSMNLPAMMNRHQFSLRVGGHTEKMLQHEWNTDKEEQFSFGILERVVPKENETATPDVLQHYQKKLEQLEKIWRLELQGTEAAGYRETKRSDQT